MWQRAEGVRHGQGGCEWRGPSLRHVEAMSHAVMEATSLVQDSPNICAKIPLIEGAAPYFAATHKANSVVNQLSAGAGAAVQFDISPVG